MQSELSHFPEVKAQSISDSVRETLRRAIIMHKLKAGSRLVEAKVSKELGVSITPVRAAFSELTIQGLLTTAPYRGTFVTIISKEYVRDVFYLREMLEVKAAELGFSTLSQENIRYLDELLQKSDVAFEMNDIYTAIQCDVKFHELMFELSNSDLLRQMWEIIKCRIEYIQSYSKPATKSRMTIRHAGMIDAIRQRDYSGYIIALKEHLHSSFYVVEFPFSKDVSYF